MRRVKHVIFWLVVIGVILLLFSTHVIAEDDSHRQRYALVETVKAEAAVLAAPGGSGGSFLLESGYLLNAMWAASFLG